MNKLVIGIDPGKSGAIVFLSDKYFEAHPMPLKNNDIDFHKVLEILKGDHSASHVFLERAVAFGMGTTSAFNYGRGFAALEIAVQLSEVPVSYIEPAKWTKVMHEGISQTKKAKEKSLIAIDRLYSKWLYDIPSNRNGKLHDGVVDALLIAGFGLRHLSK